MRQYLKATIQALGKAELDSIIDPGFVAGIKTSDPNPEIRVYSIGHEGAANLHLPGIGNKTMTWIQAAVHWVADKLSLGTAVFDRHDPTTNSHAGRTKIGEVVGKAVRQVGDRMNTLAAIYIYPQFRSRPLDIASIEAEIEYAHDGYQAWPTGISNVSGIALSNSDIDTPGFPGATLLGAVQAYVQAFGSEMETHMNLSEVKQAVKELGLTPTQIFAVDDIMGDTKVAEKVREDKRNVVAGSERIQRERDEAKERIIALENAHAESEKKLKQMQMQYKGTDTLDAILSEKKLDDKAKVFVKRNLKNFNATATDEVALKLELGTFVDTAYAEYQVLVKDVFGVDVVPKTPSGVPDIPLEFVMGTPAPNAGSPTPAQAPAYTPRDQALQMEMNPDVNPLIPGGKAATKLGT